MCGIIGLVDYPNSKRLAEKALEAMAYRGKDSTKVLHFDNVALGHNLHSIIDFVEQPLVCDNGALIINCEIYNWHNLAQDLAKTHSIYVRNDADLVSRILNKHVSSDKDFVKIINQLDGDYALAYYSKKLKKLFLARDIIGVKPLVYSFDEKTKQFAFASEKKALNAIGINAIHLNPRKILVFDLTTKKISFADRKILTTKVTKPIEETKKALIDAVQKRIPRKRFGLLLSGGLDSTMIGKILKTREKRVKLDCFFACVVDAEHKLPEPKDLISARSAAKEMGCELMVRRATVPELEHALPEIISLIESTDPVRVSVAATIYFGTKEMHHHEIKVVFSGLGADELFAGYDRFKNSNDINADCQSYLIKMYENDLYYEDIVCMKNNLELRVPFLDEKVVATAMALNPKCKLIKSKTGLVNKKILRDIALELGLSKEVAQRPKKAAQYGSNFDKAIELLAKKHNFKSKAEYLNSIGEKTISIEGTSLAVQRNIPIAALLSTGKDSLYALYLMHKQGYDVRCLVTIESKNKDSFMFHTPTTELAKLQAQALGKKLILVRTHGEKEKELKELEKGLTVAKKVFGVEGVVSGALYSNYQRQRIERICEHLGLRHFAPLWHMNQLQYLHQLVNTKVESIISKIACYGLNEKWLGRVIDAKAITDLAELEEKYKINVAGEGGEYESFVTDMPLFKKKIKLSFSKKMQNDFTGELNIKKAELVPK
jgi:asparagine synthase (glutamine-hydrolysing)